MNKKFWFASLSAATLAGLLLVNNNQVKAATTQEGTTPADHQVAADPIQNAQANVDSAQVAVNTAKNTVTNKENAVQQAKADHEGAITAYDHQSQTVQDAQKVVDHKQAALAAAQRAAADATPDKIAQAQHSLDQANQEKTAAEAAVVTKQNDSDQKQAAYNTAKSEAETAASDANAKKAALDAAKANEESKQAVLTAAKQALHNAAHERNSNQIEIDSAFKTAINQAQDYFDQHHTLATAPQSIKDAIKNAGAGLLLQNRYHSNEADQRNVINMADITDTQKNDLRMYYLNLLNGIRHQLGYEPLEYNKSAMKLSDKVAQGYEEDNWDSESRGHDVPALQAGYEDVGITRAYEEAMGYYQKGWVPDYDSTHQNPEGTYDQMSAPDLNVVTMDDVKNSLYGVVSNMLFNDESSGWGHTLTLTHPDSKYMGLSFSKYGDTLVFHMNPVDPSYIDDSTKFNQNDNLPLTTSTGSHADLQAAVDAAQHDLADASAAVIAAQTAYDQASNDKTAKDQAASAAKNALDNAKAALQTAQRAVTADQTNIERLTNQLQSLQHPRQAVQDAQRALTSAQTDLTNAQNALQALQPARDAAQHQIDAAQQAVTTARNNLQAAQTRLTQAQAQLNNLQYPAVSVDPNGGMVVQPQTPTPAVPEVPTTSVDTSAPTITENTTPAVQAEPVQLTARLNLGSIPVYNEAGQVVDHINGDQIVQLTIQMTKGAQVFYQIANSDKWVNASDLSLQQEPAKKLAPTKKAQKNKKAKKAKKTSISHKFRRIARVVKRVRLVNAHGKKTKRTLSVGTNWKTFAKKKINGKWYYRLGTQKQWVRATAMKVLKHSKF